MTKNTVTRILIVAAGLAGIIAGVAAGLHYYGVTSDAAGGNTRSTTVDLGGKPFLRWNAPRELPALSFQDEDGKSLTLADFQGRVVLLNIWATWCPPCRTEMPSLDRLNAKRGGPTFQVVALSIDNDPAAVKPFYSSIGVKTLRGFYDSKARAAMVVGAVAVPVTLLIDKNGLEIGRALGPAEWDIAAVESLIDSVQASHSSKNGPR